MPKQIILLFILFLTTLVSAEARLEKLPFPIDYDAPSNPPKSMIEITYNKNTIETFPKEIAVYQVVPPNITDEIAKKLAEKFVSKNAKKSGSQISKKFIDGDTIFSIYPMNGYYMYYISQKYRSPEDIHKEINSEDALKIAKNFIKEKEIPIPEDAVLKGVKEHHDRFVILYKRNIDKYETYGAGAVIDIDINEKGEIIRFSQSWQELKFFKNYPIKTPEKALAELLNGEGYLFNGSRGELVEATIVYYTSPQKQKYVQPFFLFKFIDNEGKEFHGIVPAIKEKYLKENEWGIQ